MKTLKNYVNGKWVEPETKGYIDIENPTTGKILARSPLSTTEEASRAIDAAYQAFKVWGPTPVARRVRPLFKLNDLLRSHEEELSRILVAEMGKSMTDARAEFKRIYENIEVACGMPVLQQGDKIIGSSYDIDGEVLRLPIGVFAMIAPFNFPGMVPFWFL
ncbi:MAG: aldehyde dehydrogenase family protein, partial [Actinomycetia bacterium]|nr:aldehyde dehydrogenase family protein [Actinomycetes bacterium]